MGKITKGVNNSILCTKGEERDFIDECEFIVRVDKVALPRGAYAIFYNTCVISDVFWSFQIFWDSWMRK